MTRALLPALALAVLLPAAAHAGKKKRAPVDPMQAIEQAATELIGKATTTTDAWEKLVELCDGIGNRLSGTENLDKAISWAQARMQSDGLVNVHTEAVMVPHWVRGEESITLLQPAVDDLPMLGLGKSVGTPPEGIEAEVVVVDSWQHLAQLGEAVRGKIVLYDVPFTTYGETVRYRMGGATEAAKLGAVASLIRSVGPTSLGTPHTGAMKYEEGVPQIPAAALSIEGAERIRRLTERGHTVRLRLKMQAHFLDDAKSANVIGEVVGREHPEEVVVLGCHLDSWDVGTGAQDDGAGCVAAMEAARLIATLDRPPARTVRVVLYTNEESGLMGGKTYADDHSDELKNHVAMMEADTGAGTPYGFRVDVATGGDDETNAAEEARVLARLEPLRHVLTPLGADSLIASFSGSDIRPSVARGVLGFGLHQDMSGYWPIHHTDADTLDKIDPAVLNKNVAVYAVWAYAIADWPDVPRVQTAEGMTQ